MTPLPKRRHSTRRSGKRETSKRKTRFANVGVCTRCGSVKLPHRKCPKCGFYK